MFLAGYGVDSEEMGSVAGEIRTLSDTLQRTARDVGRTDVQAENFGRAHHQHGQAFTDLITKLGKAVDAQCSALDDFSARLERSRGGYEFGEQSSTADVSRAWEG